MTKPRSQESLVAVLFDILSDSFRERLDIQEATIIESAMAISISMVADIRDDRALLER